MKTAECVQKFVMTQHNNRYGENSYLLTQLNETDSVVGETVTICEMSVRNLSNHHERECQFSVGNDLGLSGNEKGEIPIKSDEKTESFTPQKRGGNIIYSNHTYLNYSLYFVHEDEAKYLMRSSINEMFFFRKKQNSNLLSKHYQKVRQVYNSPVFCRDIDIEWI